MEHGCLLRRLGLTALALLFPAVSVFGQSIRPAPAPGLPPSPQLRFVYEEQVALTAAIPFGETPMGRRSMVPIVGGTFSGPGLQGKVLPGGWDWQLLNGGGCFSLHADYMIQTSDGVLIHVLNAGMICPHASGLRDTMLTTPVFEAPKGKYDWLNGGAYVGTVDGMTLNGKPAVRIRFFKAFAP